MRFARVLLAAVVVVPTFLGTTTTARAGSTPICVAMVVDASHAGAAVTSTCAKGYAGGSGSDFLEAAGHRVRYKPSYGRDFVCAIDGIPAEGCAATDNTHSWVYYHRSPGGSTWQLSTEGAGSYQPANASTEGWVYNDGAATDPQPRNVPYARICPPTVSATPAPHPVQPPPPAAATSGVSSTPGLSPNSSAGPVASSPPSPTRPRVGGSGPPTRAAFAAPTPAATLSRPGPNRTGSVPVGLILGLSAGALLSVGAFRRLRRGNG